MYHTITLEKYAEHCFWFKTHFTDYSSWAFTFGYPACSWLRAINLSMVKPWLIASNYVILTPLILFKHGQIHVWRACQKSLASQIVEIVETISHQEYIKTFNKWLERMRLCVENKGDYFEILVRPKIFYIFESCILLFFLTFFAIKIIFRLF